MKALGLEFDDAVTVPHVVMIFLFDSTMCVCVQGGGRVGRRVSVLRDVDRFSSVPGRL